MKSSFKLPPVVKDFPLTLLVLLLVLFFSPLFLAPNIRKATGLKEQIDKERERLSLLSQKLADLQNLSEAELVDEAKLLTEALPADNDFYQSLTVVKKIFADNGVTMDSFKFSPGEVSTQAAVLGSNKAQGKIEYQVSFSSSFESFANFVSAVEKTLPLLEIESIKFNFLGTASSSANLLSFEGVLGLRSFYSPLPSTIGKIDSPVPKVNNQERQLIEDLRTYSRVQEASPEAPVVIGRENPFSI